MHPEAKPTTLSADPGPALPREGGPEEADLGETVARLAPGLLRYCLARTGQPDLAEELAQEALTALVARWRGRGAVRSPEAFVFTVARRRLGRRLLYRRLAQPLEALFGVRDPSPGPAEDAHQRERARNVRKALSCLGARDREVLLLVAGAELSMSEGARVLGISTSAVKMRLARARERLGRLLAEEEAAGAGPPIHRDHETELGAPR